MAIFRKYEFTVKQPKVDPNLIDIDIDDVKDFIEKTYVAKIKVMTWRERDEIFRQASEIKFVGNEQQTTVNPVLYKELMLSIGIMEIKEKAGEFKPFNINRDNMKGNDITYKLGFNDKVFDELHQQVLKTNFLAQTTGENTIVQ